MLGAGGEAFVFRTWEEIARMQAHALTFPACDVPAQMSCLPFAHLDVGHHIEGRVLYNCNCLSRGKAACAPMASVVDIRQEPFCVAHSKQTASQGGGGCIACLAPDMALKYRTGHLLTVSDTCDHKFELSHEV